MGEVGKEGEGEGDGFFEEVEKAEVLQVFEGFGGGGREEEGIEGGDGGREQGGGREEGGEGRGDCVEGGHVVGFVLL